MDTTTMNRYWNRYGFPYANAVYRESQRPPELRTGPAALSWTLIQQLDDVAVVSTIITEMSIELERIQTIGADEYFHSSLGSIGSVPSLVYSIDTFTDLTSSPHRPLVTSIEMVIDLVVFMTRNDWIRNFISSRGNEYFCEIDEEYLTDRFNLTGLNTEVHYYQHALDLITDVFDLDCEDDMRETIEKSARHLYGLVHARYIVTTRGMAKMVDKYKRADFGKCPRVLCESQPLLPMGLSDNPGAKSVKLYCAKCEDIYNPKSSRHAAIDGAYFGASFHNILFQIYPALVPVKSRARHVARVFGFRVHAAAALARWQDGDRAQLRDRLRAAGIENTAQLFVEDADSDDGAATGDEEMEADEEVEAAAEEVGAQRRT